MIDEYELDLYKIFKNLWNNKWIITPFIIIALLFVLIYQFFKPDESFLMSAEISEIPYSKANLYSNSNSFGFFEVEPILLQNLYIDQFNHEFSKIISSEEIFNHFSMNNIPLIVTPQFDIDNNRALTLKEQLKVKDKFKKSKWVIEYKHNDLLKWKSSIQIAHEYAVINVHKILLDRFETAILIEKQNIDFEIADIKNRISNAYKVYERNVSNRIAVLQEQSIIARSLQIAKPLKEFSELLLAINSKINEKDQISFETISFLYLMGYESLDKEIEILQNRDNVKPFIEGLEQLQNKLDFLHTASRIERAKTLLYATPLGDSNLFEPVHFKIKTSEIIYLGNKLKVEIVIAIIIGLISGIIFIFLLNILRNRRIEE